jgi:hypothetical protein
MTELEPLREGGIRNFCSAANLPSAAAPLFYRQYGLPNCVEAVKMSKPC